MACALMLRVAMDNVLIVSRHSNRLIGLGDGGLEDNDWLWTVSDQRAHVFSREAAHVFVREHLVESDVWFQRVRHV